MELKHHFVVPASLEDTWRAFNQLEDIAPCFPGAALTSVEGEQFTGTVKVKLGPIAMVYSGTGEFVERNEDTHTVVISAAGKDKRGNGTAGATVTAVLTPDAGGTAVDVTTDMNVTGKPAQFGRGVIQDVSDKLLAEFVQCVIGKVGGEAGEAAEAAAPESLAADAPSGEPAAPEASPAAAPSTGEAAATSGAAAPRATAPHATAPKAAPASAAELDLGSAVLPALMRRLAPVLLGAAAVIGLIFWLARRRR
ncbi:SRPBCC family protein [Arthrobacter sp. CJ23]|uniref:SRPBCC family protein n=1 Tax=Arthrobacter sp. CJ23 TaxID=2972479 RepID=UPI00215CF10B|nr:SRPBCC family protein [Arthrobacter sp. CJ23]UVJ41438.1 SRPBCC family protein [Arthrobacter sp. CJ23]